jgi:hypothetical protein
LRDELRENQRSVRISSYGFLMHPGTPTIEASAPPATTRNMRRRNHVEALVRDRLAPTEDVYVLSSSWHQNGAGPEPLVAVIARNDEARGRAREALADIAGLSAEQWRTSWTPLSLGDWMIWLFPERACT